MSDKVNFGNVAREYAKFRDEIPDIIFEQLRERHIEFSGKQVIDLGSGSGIFSRAMVQQGAKVTGIEAAASLISEAEAIDHSLGMNIHYMHSTAEEWTLPANQFDMVTAVRAWHWFDRSKVNQLVKRSLKPAGYLLVINSVFVSDQSPEVQETLKAIKEFIAELRPAGSMGDPKKRRTGFPVVWFEEWEEHEFRIIDEWQYDYQLHFSIENWCGKVRSLSWLTNESQEKKDLIIKKVKEYLDKFNQPLTIPHKYSILVLQKKIP